MMTLNSNRIRRGALGVGLVLVGAAGLLLVPLPSREELDRSAARDSNSQFVAIHNQASTHQVDHMSQMTGTELSNAFNVMVEGWYREVDQFIFRVVLWGVLQVCAAVVCLIGGILLLKVSSSPVVQAVSRQAAEPLPSLDRSDSWIVAA